MQILIADDDSVTRRMIQLTLEEAGYDVIAVANGGLAAEQLFRTGGPRLCLLDWVMPEVDGLEVCRMARERSDQPYIYVILLTAKDSKEDLLRGLAAGADDFLTKPYHGEELKARVRTGQRILQLQDRLFHDARYDTLTGLPNRLYFLDELDRCAERSKQSQHYHFAVLFVDLDRFKAVNDDLGHAAGDELLNQVGKRVLSVTRRSTGQSGGGRIPRTANDCTVARLGGDEFTVLMDGISDSTEVSALADDIRRELSRTFFIAGSEVNIGASVGIAISAAGGAEVRDMMRDADAAMYEAKATGKVALSVRAGRDEKRAVSQRSGRGQLMALPLRHAGN